MKTVSKCCVAVCLLSGFNAYGKDEIRPYSVLPEPQQVAYSKGSFKLKDKLTIAFPPKLANEATYCRDVARHVSAAANPILQEGKKSGDITLVLDASVLSKHPEGYILDIQSKGIVIKANAPAGILYGIQTLRQLLGAALEASGQAGTIQCGTITDYPTLGWRAFLLDEARHFLGKEVVLKLLDNMSRLKMNVFHWHLVDIQGWRIEIKKYPELTKTGAARDNSSFNKSFASFYTQEEIREIVAYAAARHITIVPEIEIPGHSGAAIASYPWLGSADVLNLTNPAVEDFIKDMLEEIIALFPGNVIHIGGDEVTYRYWKNTPSIVQYMQEHNILSPADLQVSFTNRIAHWLAAKNRRIMGWNEVLGKVIPDYWRPMLPEDHIITQPLTSNAIVHCWEGNIDLIRETIQEGYDIVNSFHLLTYLDLLGNKYIPLEKAYSFQPVPEGLTAEQQKKVLGLGCQMWTEQVPDEQNMNTKVYPRIAAYAEVGWTAPEKKDYNSFLKRLDYFLAEWEKQGIRYGQVQPITAPN
ncbi:beta-N-acetylhexosaminidase [Candidatus Symbiothrix dinenymphae]|uniref:beta-N-acetylhexosaminidase n=1 Tax=Candidatus Symbiothrix dinenymphae TaxID=467085 RepID=UPI0009ECB15C|nr:beta-N-acetylhexosaminidase [Candidatus Symbiothrix dinenymphae]